MGRPGGVGGGESECDNATALTALAKMRRRKPAIGIIARELAMRLAALSFPPYAMHTPGISHVAADALSRGLSPDDGGVGEASLPPSLEAATISVPLVCTMQGY